MVKGKS